MNVALTSALIATLTSITVVFLQAGLKAISTKQKIASEINSAYLNPLRLYTEETFFRLYDINSRLIKGQRESLLFLPKDTQSHQLSAQDDGWLNGEGCYFVSSCYFTACLFACIKKVREDIPYLKLRGRNDTALPSALFAVSRGFLSDLGIFYAIQHSIGSELYLHSEQRLVTYREFCKLIQTPEKRVWFDRLLSFYLDINQGKRQANLTATMTALYGLAQFCDRIAQGNSSIDERLRTEGHPPFQPRR